MPCRVIIILNDNPSLPCPLRTPYYEADGIELRQRQDSSYIAHESPVIQSYEQAEVPHAAQIRKSKMANGETEPGTQCDQSAGFDRGHGSRRQWGRGRGGPWAGTEEGRTPESSTGQWVEEMLGKVLLGRSQWRRGAFASAGHAQCQQVKWSLIPLIDWLIDWLVVI